MGASLRILRADVSLSLRGLVRVRSAAAPKRGEGPLGPDWAALADPHSTTVFHMGRSAATKIGRNLQAAIRSDAPLLLLDSDVRSASERLLDTRLDRCTSQ